MAGFTAAGIAFDTVTNESSAGADDASQLAPLGFELTRQSPTADEGLQTWIYVKANGALTAGMVVGRGDSVSTYSDVIPAATTTGIPGVVGVCVHAIGDNGYGFILKKGVCSVVAGTGTIDDNEAIIVDSTDAGTAMRATSGAGVSTDAGFGFAHADAAATASASCYINCTG